MADPLSISTCTRVGRHALPTTDTASASSFLWFAALQGIERIEDLTSLAPEGCFIAAEAIKREVGQIGETQKTTRELNGSIECRFNRFRAGAGHSCCIRDAMR